MMFREKKIEGELGLFRPICYIRDYFLCIFLNKEACQIAFLKGDLSPRGAAKQGFSLSCCVLASRLICALQAGDAGARNQRHERLRAQLRDDERRLMY